MNTVSAKEIRRCPPGVLVHVIFPAASHRRIVRVHTPIIDAAMPILTYDAMMVDVDECRHLNPNIIHFVSTFVQIRSNCLATLCEYLEQIDQLHYVEPVHFRVF